MQELITVPAAPQDAVGIRVDVYIASVMENVSRSGAQKMLEEGLVSCGGVVLRKNYRLQGGEELSVLYTPPKEIDAKPENIPLDVVYEDEDVIVVNKPQGMVVHPAPGNETGTLVNALLYHFQGKLSGINGALRPGIVHRIDKNTSGLLMIAKNDRAHHGLAAQIEKHSFLREYEAVVVGVPGEDEGTVDRPIGRNPRDRKQMAVVADGKRAVTHYTVLERFRGYAHIRCRLETGRTHQIRVHMKSIGHPVLGDDVYGQPPAPAFSFEKGQVLCAKKLGFAHPADGRWIQVECPLPEDFQRTLEILRHSFLG